MSKSVYSLVLSDEVVSEIDRMAYKDGLSRSNLIDFILADYISMETPQKRMQDIFGHMERLFSQSSNMRFLNQPSLSMASIVSALSYRYKPTVKYQVELFDDEKFIGQIKISMRTQNSALLGLMGEFFTVWKALEEKYFGRGELSFVDESGRFYRKFTPVGGARLTPDEISDAISEYIEDMNNAMNIYFKNCQSSQDEYLPVIESYYASTQGERAKI